MSLNIDSLLDKDKNIHACLVQNIGSKLDILPLHAVSGTWDGKSMALAKNPQIYAAACVLGVAPMPEKNRATLVCDRESFRKLAGMSVSSIDDLYVLAGAQQIDSGAYHINGFPSDKIAHEHGVELVFDEYSDTRFEYRNNTDSFSSIGYHGAIPVDVQLAAMSKYGLRLANRMWSKDAFISLEHKTISKASYAKNLLSALGLGIADVPEYPALPDIGEYRLNSIMQFDSLDFEMAAEAQDAARIYSFYDDLVELWEHVIDKSRLCLQLSIRDIRMEKVCRHALSEYGAALGMESYIDALASGVPLEDILA